MRHAIVTLAAIILTACGVSPDLSPRDCTPGATSPCACVGAVGVQTCDVDGSLGACACSTLDAGRASEDAPSGDAAASSAPSDRPDAPSIAPDATRAPMGLQSDAATLSVSDASADDGAEATAPACRAEERCEGRCGVDYLSDANHCAGCGRACLRLSTRHVPTCERGTCVVRCIAGYVPCGPNVCVSANAAGFDCSQCGFSCLEGLRCELSGRRGVCVPR